MFRRSDTTTKEPHIVVLGGTGHGKSTFINGLANFFLQGSLPDDIKVAIKTQFLRGNLGWKDTETGGGKSMVSQTNECTSYRFVHPVTKQVFHFVDTPGLSDTRGVATDDKNVERVIKAAELCPHLSAMILIVNGSQARFTIELQNIFTRLRGILPDVILQNVIVVFTNTWEHERNFNIDSLRYVHDKDGNKVRGADGKEIVLLPLRNDHIFHLNNTAFSSDPTRWTPRIVSRLQLDWNECNTEIQEILTLVTSMNNLSSTVFTKMRASRDQIKSALTKAKLDIIKLQEIQDKIDESQAALGRFANDTEMFKNYKQETTVKTMELVDAGYHSTMCSRCNHVCHDHCGLNEVSGKGSDQFMNCAAMSGANCTVCPGKCSYRMHFHDRKTMREVEKTLETELEDMKQKYLAAQQGTADARQQLNTHAAAEKAIDDAIIACTKRVEQSCHDLKQLCSGFNFVDELAITIQQLEFEARSLRSLRARNSAEKVIRMLKALVDKLNLEDGKGGLIEPAGGWGPSRPMSSSSSSSSSSSFASSALQTARAPLAHPASSSSSFQGEYLDLDSLPDLPSLSVLAPVSARLPAPAPAAIRGTGLSCQVPGCANMGKPVPGKFCGECGTAPKPLAQAFCQQSGCAHYGRVVTAKFCEECGQPPSPLALQRVCQQAGCEQRGRAVTGKFCPECGNCPG